MINNIASLTPAFTGNLAGKPKDQSKIQDAAQQFEGLMIGELLKTAREASGGDGGWLGTGDDQSGQIAVEMAEQQLALTMAKQGGFGLTKSIVRQLEPAATAAASRVQR